jgi:hypothetical protein
MCQEILLKLSNSKFHQNPFGRSPVAHVDRRMDRHEKGAFLQLLTANTPSILFKGFTLFTANTNSLLQSYHAARIGPITLTVRYNAFL